MGASPRYRLDFAVPADHDIAEPDDVVRNPTLDLVRANLAADDRWERSMLAPWRPYGEQQHLIVWVDLAEARDATEIGNAVLERVSQVLPGVTLLEVFPNPPT